MTVDGKKENWKWWETGKEDQAGETVMVRWKKCEIAQPSGLCVLPSPILKFTGHFASNFQSFGLHAFQLWHYGAFCSINPVGHFLQSLPVFFNLFWAEVASHWKKSVQTHFFKMKLYLPTNLYYIYNTLGQLFNTIFLFYFSNGWNGQASIVMLIDANTSTYLEASFHCLIRWCQASCWRLSALYGYQTSTSKCSNHIHLHSDIKQRLTWRT